MASAAAAHYGLAPSFTIFGDLRKVWVKEGLERERERNYVEGDRNDRKKNKILL
jgi:hypothetical protein